MEQRFNTTMVRIRATRCKEQPDGTFELEIPAEPLLEEQHKLLRQLFPHTSDKVYDLLNVETMLAAYVPPDQWSHD